MTECLEGEAEIAVFYYKPFSNYLPFYLFLFFWFVLKIFFFF